jgi:hypothetical protein
MHEIAGYFQHSGLITGRLHDYFSGADIDAVFAEMLFEESSRLLLCRRAVSRRAAQRQTDINQEIT